MTHRTFLAPMVAAALASFAALAPGEAFANPKTFHTIEEGSSRVVDHGAWSAFLDAYLKRTGDGRAVVDYGAVTSTDKAALKDYIGALASVDPTALGRAEAFAYWVNLYNAVTIDVVLDHYPVESIRAIRSGLRPGPWRKKLVAVGGEALSLDNIEHDILRPFFRDPRIHYAVNCASYGCPDLAPRAYSGEALEAMLDAAARGYVNHPRGARFDGDELVLSSIYKWYAEDFGDDDAGVIAHVRQYASPALGAKLDAAEKIDDYEYDWSLNDAP